MSKRKTSIHFQPNLQEIFLFLLAGLLFGLFFHIEQATEEGGYPRHLVAVFWVLSLIFCLWLGNLLIYRVLQRQFPWESSLNKRYFLQLILTLLYSLLCINATYFLFKDHYTELPPSQNQLILLNIYGTLFLLPVLSIQFGLLFLQKWKKAIVEQEKLKKEQIQSELVTLKSHLSPHFLFNNLNILSSLISEQNQDAQDFLNRFSEVYRYVLKNRNVELISLREELEFLKSYNFLLHRRFSDSLKIHTEVAPALSNHLLPPLALQMVLENALKHNKLSEVRPLQVSIRSDESPALIVQNNLQIRDLADHEKTGFGLDNIRRRYWLIARERIEVKNNSDTFSVKLPLITTEPV